MTVSETPTPSRANFSAVWRRLGHAADARVGDDALHRRAAGVAEVLGNQLGHRLGHAHRLVFQRLADALAAAVDGRPDADLGKRSDETIFQRNSRSCHS